MSDEELVRGYLLGDLPGDEQEALEKRLLSEDDLFELAEALEAEVLEDYADGELAPAQQEHVASYLAASPEGRLRLAVVRGLSATADMPASTGRLLPFRPTALPAAAKVRALAAMLAMAAGAALLASIQVGIVHPPAPPPPHRPVAPAPLPEATPAPAPPPVLFVATIALSNLRGAAQVPSFDVPSNADEIELRLTLPAGDEGYRSYRIVLNDDAEQQVTKSEGLHASRKSGQIALRMDADQLPAGRYSLTVQGVTPAGDVEDLAFPEFEVHEP